MGNVAFLRRDAAADGGRQLRPPVSKAQRKAAKMARQIERDEKDVDMDINRALDAIALLAQNKNDPPALILRISTVEQTEITENIEKALEWLLPFANHWRNYVQNGFVQSQNPAARDDGRTRPRRRLHLVSEGDSNGKSP